MRGQFLSLAVRLRTTVFDNHVNLILTILYYKFGAFLLILSDFP